MLVDVSMDRMGNVVARPRSARIARKYTKHLAGFGVKSDGSAFFQEGGPASEFLADLKPGQVRDLESGWDVTLRLDPWVFGQWLGWDACEVQV